jgi:xanthine dehydrogenase accessory factor
MIRQGSKHMYNDDPLEALLIRDAAAVLAIIIGVEGPSYRPVGAMMAVFGEKERVGSLSSGCIESDICLHAMEALDAGQVKQLRYGRGSPFRDIELPCGGGLDILLLPRPDRAVLEQVAQARLARKPVTLEINLESGALQLSGSKETHRGASQFWLHFQPRLRFLVFGKGPEAAQFAGLVQSLGYPNLCLSPDEETLAVMKASGCKTRHLVSRALPADLRADAWSAAVLFFHDHDWEPPLLAGLVETDAFYIGAQGSQRARDTRLAELAAMGVTPEARARLRGPIGLIPSARDADTLAVSVLAEVLALAKTRGQLP